LFGQDNAGSVVREVVVPTFSGKLIKVLQVPVVTDWTPGSANDEIKVGEVVLVAIGEGTTLVRLIVSLRWT